MGNSLTYQERRGGHSTNSARGNLPGPARTIRTGHEAKLHERLLGWREVEIRGAGAVGHGRAAHLRGQVDRRPVAVLKLSPGPARGRMPSSPSREWLCALPAPARNPRDARRAGPAQSEPSDPGMLRHIMRQLRRSQVRYRVVSLCQLVFV
jgi:hypothetical protein